MAFLTNRRLLTAVVILALASATACFGLLLRETDSENRIEALSRRLERLESARLQDTGKDSPTSAARLRQIEDELAALKAGLADARAQSERLNQKLAELEMRRSALGEALRSLQQTREDAP